MLDFQLVFPTGTLGMVGVLAVVDCRSPHLGETIVSPRCGLRQSTTAKTPTIPNVPVGKTN